MHGIHPQKLQFAIHFRADLFPAAAVSVHHGDVQSVLHTLSPDLIAHGTAKFRPGTGPAVFTTDTKQTVLDLLHDPVNFYAQRAESKLGIPGAMTGWRSTVMQRVTETLNTIPLDTPLQECTPLGYHTHDASAMRAFLDRYQGHGVVCTTMDKAANTMIFRCPKAYVSDTLADFCSASVYTAVTEDADSLLQSHNAFLTSYGVPIDRSCQDLPHYVATMKLHKQPPGCRYISSSATSSMQVVSVWLNRLFNALLPEIDHLFAKVMKDTGIAAFWTHRSWILKNTAEVIPLIQAWNQIYAATSASSTSPPYLQTFDFERLYTNIDTNDMLSSIMELVRDIFSSDTRHQFAGIKVCTTKKAQWLKQDQMPASDQSRFKRGKGGNSFVFDVDTISTWLAYLLQNMFVTFGEQVQRQTQGTPMGTNCASHLANFFLAMYELRFLRHLSAIIANAALPDPLRHTARHIFHAFLLTRRYIDDLLSINNPYLKLLRYTTDHPFFPEIHGIYPPALSLACTSAGTSVSYMDISITPTPGQTHLHRLTTILYDKREHPPLSDLCIIKFPHISSNISATAKYGIITSQFHRYRRIIMWREDFIFRLARLVKELANKGYILDNMRQQILRLCRQYPSLYGTHSDKLTADINSKIDDVMTT